MIPRPGFKDSHDHNFWLAFRLKFPPPSSILGRGSVFVSGFVVSMDPCPERIWGFCIFSKKERYLGPTLLGLARKVGGIRGQWNSLVRRRVFDCRNPCELDVFRKDSEILSFHFEKPSLESESAQSLYI